MKTSFFAGVICIGIGSEAPVQTVFGSKREGTTILPGGGPSQRSSSGPWIAGLEAFASEEHSALRGKSLSDRTGTDLNIHGGTVAGIMRELCNAFVRRRGPRPTVPQMMQTYRIISQRKTAIMASARSNSLLEACVFEDLYFATRAAVEETRGV